MFLFSNYLRICTFFDLIIFLSAGLYTILEVLYSLNISIFLAINLYHRFGYTIILQYVFSIHISVFTKYAAVYWKYFYNSYRYIKDWYS